jgi:excisionase family DNA binding protein
MDTTTTASSTHSLEVRDDDKRPDPRSTSSQPTALNPGDRLVLTVAEAGALLGISRAFAYELVARGELPVLRLGRRVVVPKVALLAMVGSAEPAG